MMDQITRGKCKPSLGNMAFLFQKICKYWTNHVIGLEIITDFSERISEMGVKIAFNLTLTMN